MHVIRSTSDSVFAIALPAASHSTWKAPLGVLAPVFTLIHSWPLCLLLPLCGMPSSLWSTCCSSQVPFYTSPHGQGFLQITGWTREVWLACFPQENKPQENYLSFCSCFFYFFPTHSKIITKTEDTSWLPPVSVQFSCSVMSESLQPHESQHARPPCPSPTPGVHPNPCPSSQWCHPTISSSVIPFSSCPESFPASWSFQMNQLFPSGDQNTGVSASASVLPMNTQDWSPLGWTGWISLQSKGLSRVFSNTTVQKHPFFGAQFSL